MTNGNRKEPRQGQNKPEWYEIQVEGEINPGWFSWMDSWEITTLPDGNTLLVGPVIDQPALHGLFAHIRDLNLKIIFLKRTRHSPDVES